MKFTKYHSAVYWHFGHVISRAKFNDISVMLAFQRDFAANFGSFITFRSTQNLYFKDNAFSTCSLLPLKDFWVSACCINCSACRLLRNSVVHCTSTFMLPLLFLSLSLRRFLLHQLKSFSLSFLCFKSEKKSLSLPHFSLQLKVATLDDGCKLKGRINYMDCLGCANTLQQSVQGDFQKVPSCHTNRRIRTNGSHI